MQHFSPDLLHISVNGYCAVFAFKEYARKQLKLEEESDETVSYQIKALAKKVVKQCQSAKTKSKFYDLDVNNSAKYGSEIISNLLGCISKKLGPSTAPGILIKNIIHHAVTAQYSPLQLSLSLFLRQHFLIQELYKYYVCCSYDENRRLLTSIAHNSIRQSESKSNRGVSSENNMFVTAVDNFDLNISS